MILKIEALIKEVKNKSLVSGDKSTQVILEFNSSDKTEELNNLNELQKADSLVTVVIMDEEEATKAVEKQ